MACDRGPQCHTIFKTTSRSSFKLEVPMTSAQNHDTQHNTRRESVDAIFETHNGPGDNDPPPYGVEVSPPTYHAGQSLTALHAGYTGTLFQRDATFFTHITITYPAKARPMFPDRTTAIGPTLHMSTEPVRLACKTTFEDLQLVLKTELAQRRISTQLADGFRLVGRLKTARRERRRLVWSLKGAAFVRQVHMPTKVHAENWPRVLEALSKQEVRGLELNVWPQAIELARDVG